MYYWDYLKKTPADLIYTCDNLLAPLLPPGSPFLPPLVLFARLSFRALRHPCTLNLPLKDAPVTPASRNHVALIVREPDIRHVRGVANGRAHCRLFVYTWVPEKVHLSIVIACYQQLLRRGTVYRIHISPVLALLPNALGGPAKSCRPSPPLYVAQFRSVPVPLSSLRVPEQQFIRPTIALKPPAVLTRALFAGEVYVGNVARVTFQDRILVVSFAIEQVDSIVMARHPQNFAIRRVLDVLNPLFAAGKFF